MKKILMALMAVAMLCGVTSCKVNEVKDVLISVTNGGSNEGLLASTEVFPMYVEEIALQAGLQATSNYVILRAQTDYNQAREIASQASKEAKNAVLAKGTFKTIVGTYEVTEGTEEKHNMVIYVSIDGETYITHYYTAFSK